jgi:mono/diheme cytochrome c family protein
MSKVIQHRMMVVGTLAVGVIAGVYLILPLRSRAVETTRIAATSQPATSQATAGRLSVVAFSPVEAGRYLVRITGCNDCHTAGWDQSGGKVPESQWLTGVPIGFRGPWGTTYAANLRLYVKDFTPDSWVAVMRVRNQQPPMPWTSLHAMSDSDLRAILAYIQSLGPAGNEMPKSVSPAQDPKTPYFVFTPQMPATTKAATGAAAPAVVQPSTRPAK